MKHAWFVALTLGLLIPATADARKECRPKTQPETVREDENASGLAWARSNDSSWVHADDSSWVHADSRAAVEGSEADGDESDEFEGTPSWVHDTDYGWWAGVPEQALNGVDGEDGVVPETGFDDEGMDCTVSRDRNECVVLGNQVANYRFRLALAIDRDDERWAENLMFTIQRLEAKAVRRGCIWVRPSIQEQVIHTLNEVIKAVGVAAEVYSMFYRMGLF